MPGKPVLKIIMFPKQLPEISPWSKLVFTPLKGTKFSDNPKFNPYTAPCTCKRSNDEHDNQYQYGYIYLYIHFRCYISDTPVYTVELAGHV